MAHRELMHDWIAEYWREIHDGTVIVCKKTRTVYDRLHAEALEDKGRWTYSLQAANRPILFIEKFCHHSKGQWAGKPVRLETWQKAFVAALFGFIDRETGERRFTEAFLCVARKSGKSTLAACILLFLFLAEGQADIYCAASKLDQAALIFNEALAMVQQSPFLRKRIRKRRNDMWLEETRSVFKPLGRNSSTMDGLNASGICIDECHALDGGNGRNLYEVLRQSQSARKSSVLLVVTTAGYVRNGPYDDLYGLASNILDGTLTGGAADRFLPIVYELDNPEEWHELPDENGITAEGKRSAWYKSNPSLEPQGRVKSLDFLRAECIRAEANPVDVPGVLTKDFNVPQSGAGKWLQYSDILNDATVPIEECAGRWAICGADLSKAGDLTCCTAVIPHDEGLWICRQMYWIPSEGLRERIERDKVPYNRWIEQGLCRVSQGAVIRTEDVTEWLLELVNDHDISVHSVWYDAWSATRWVDEMKGLGFRMVPVHQGAKTLSLPLEHLEAALRARQIVYDRNPILLWCLTNAATETDRNGNRLLVKSLSARHRIDGAASLLDAWVGICNTPNFRDM